MNNTPNFKKFCENTKDTSSTLNGRNLPLYHYMKELVTSEPFNYNLIEQKEDIIAAYLIASRVSGERTFKCIMTQESIYFTYPVITDILYNDRSIKPTIFVVTKCRAFRRARDIDNISDDIYIKDAKIWWSINNKFESGRSAQEISKAFDFAIDQIDKVTDMYISRQELVDSHIKYKQMHNIELSDEDWGRML